MTSDPTNAIDNGFVILVASTFALAPVTDTLLSASSPLSDQYSTPPAAVSHLGAGPPLERRGHCGGPSYPRPRRLHRRLRTLDQAVLRLVSSMKNDIVVLPWARRLRYPPRVCSPRSDAESQPNWN